MLEIIDEAADWGVVFFGLTGGEPTIFKGWLEVVERVLERGMVPSLDVSLQSPNVSPRLAWKKSPNLIKNVSCLTKTVRNHPKVVEMHEN